MIGLRQPLLSFGDGDDNACFEVNVVSGGRVAVSSGWGLIFDFAFDVFDVSPVLTKPGDILAYELFHTVDHQMIRHTLAFWGIPPRLIFRRLDTQDFCEFELLFPQLRHHLQNSLFYKPVLSVDNQTSKRHYLWILVPRQVRTRVSNSDLGRLWLIGGHAFSFPLLGNSTTEKCLIGLGWVRFFHRWASERF